MQAAVLHEDRTLRVETVSALPPLRSGSASVRVLAVQMPNFAINVVSGALNYAHAAPPVILGASAIGEIISVADDVYDPHLRPGAVVFCDPLVGNASNHGSYDFILQSWTALGPDSMKTQQEYRDGTWAEQFVTPAECLTVIRRPEMAPAAQWSTLCYFSFAYGALIKGDFKPGQAVVIAGATGGIGSCAVFLALACGASKVFALGRNEQSLQRLVRADPARVVPVRLGGDCDAATALKEALSHDFSQVDLALDFLGQAETPEVTLACLASLKRGGILVLYGSMLCPLPINYGEVMRRELQIRGAFMWERSAPGMLIRMVEGGLLKLGDLDISTHPLAEVTQCMEQARKCSALQFAVLEPGK